MSPMSGRSSASSSKSRLNEPPARIFTQKDGPNAVTVGLLSVGLVFGIIGLAAHAFWVIAVIIMALGLGFAAVSRRRDHIDTAIGRADDAEDKCDSAQVLASSVGMETRESRKS